MFIPELKPGLPAFSSQGILPILPVDHASCPTAPRFGAALQAFGSSLVRCGLGFECPVVECLVVECWGFECWGFECWDASSELSSGALRSRDARPMIRVYLAIPRCAGVNLLEWLKPSAAKYGYAAVRRDIGDIARPRVLRQDEETNADPRLDG